jgi:hypothetical protein
MDCKMPTAKEKIRCYSSQCSARLSANPNGPLVNLMEQPETGDCEGTSQVISQPDS